MASRFQLISPFRSRITTSSFYSRELRCFYAKPPQGRIILRNTTRQQQEQKEQMLEEQINLEPMPYKPKRWIDLIKGGQEVRSEWFRNMAMSAQSAWFLLRSANAYSWKTILKISQEGLDVYRELNDAIAAGNKETIRQLAYLKVSKNCLEEIAQRPRDLNYVYKLENPKVSLKSLAVQKTEDMLGVNMMIRVRGNQSAYVESRSGELLAGSPAAKPVDELVHLYYLDFQGIKSRQRGLNSDAGIMWKMFHKEPYSTALTNPKN